MDLFGWLVVWLICIVGGLSLGREKNRPSDGVIWALLFGPLGVIIVALLQERYTGKCPYCLKGIPKEAKRCFQCCADLPAAPADDAE
jgi:hypothetical protein